MKKSRFSESQIISILNQISQWKREFQEHAGRAFDPTGKKDNDEEVDIKILCEQIGQLKVENDFLKKSVSKARL